MKNYQTVIKGVNDILELKHKKIQQEAERQKELKMLLDMKMEGVLENIILKVAIRNNLSEAETKKILNSK